MDYFDVHHHHTDGRTGIYNVKLHEKPPASGFFSAGLHPLETGTITAKSWQWLKKIAAHSRCVALGECGLDGRNPETAELQLFLFKRQIELASQLQKPMILHAVKCDAQLQQLAAKIKVPAIIHGFNRRKTVADALLDKGFYLSFGKSVLYHVHLQEVIRTIPAGRFFLETDASETDIKAIYQKVAQLRGVSVTELQEQIRQNLTIFNIH